MDRKKEIVSIIESISGKYSAYEVFSDWIRCMALSISNSSTVPNTKIWREREDMYLSTMQKYTAPEQQKLCKMMGCLVDTLEDGPDDVLGKIYMGAGMGSKTAGQFFTPFHLSELTARIGVEEFISTFDGNTKLTLSEPACGGGAMIIAAAKALRDNGIDYQNVMDVVAQDLDWKGVYMCYVQLSLLGISAICIQGDTLSEPYCEGYDRSRVLYTPRRAGCLI